MNIIIKLLASFLCVKKGRLSTSPILYTAMCAISAACQVNKERKERDNFLSCHALLLYTTLTIREV